MAPFVASGRRLPRPGGREKRLGPTKRADGMRPFDPLICGFAE
jgi:hypothetical protein